MLFCGDPLVKLAVQDGNAVAVWEWVSDDPFSSHLEDVIFGAVIAAMPGEASLGGMVVDGSLAPVSAIHFASTAVVPIPRFVASPRSVIGVVFNE
jgi:hypothetical protein